MLEVAFITLITGLFVYQTVYFRKLTKKQVNKAMMAFDPTWDSVLKKEKVVTVPAQPIPIQEPINRFER